MKTTPTTMIAIAKIESNTGQIKGVPKNPTTIKDDRHKALMKSMKEFPQLLPLRELIVFPFKGKYITIAGHRRLNAGIQLKFKEMPCKVLPADTDIKVLKRIAVIDNVKYSEIDWAALEGDDWNASELLDWGITLEEPTPSGGVQVTFKPSTSIKLKYNTQRDHKRVTEALALIDKDPATAVMISLGLKKGGKK